MQGLSQIRAANANFERDFDATAMEASGQAVVRYLDGLNCTGLRAFADPDIARQSIIEHVSTPGATASLAFITPAGRVWEKWGQRNGLATVIDAQRPDGI